MKRFSYNNQTLKGSSPVKKVIFTIGFFVLIFVCFLYGTGALSSGNQGRQRESLETAISRDIIYCYAMTGSYPESLEQIKSNYGLIYDEDLFFVDYRVRGSNIMPEITIIERNGNAN